MAIVRYLVNDADTAVAFYTKHLGFVLGRLCAIACLPATTPVKGPVNNPLAD
jgi:hypothetical protein